MDIPEYSLDSQQFTDETTVGLRAITSKPMLTRTLVIGLGGTGTEAVRHLKRRLVWLWHRTAIEEESDRVPAGVDPSVWHQEVWRRFEMEGGPPVVQLLTVDTWPWSNRAGQVYLNNHEYAYIGGYNATRVLGHLHNHPEIAEWWRWPADEIRPGQIHSGARQIRAIGRLSLYYRYRRFWRKLKFQIDRMIDMEARQETEDRRHQVASPEATRRIYIVCSLCGGTGAGTVLDVAARLRAEFAEQAIISGVFALPSVFLSDLNSDLQKERVRANAYAALKELTYFQSHPFHLWLPGEEPVDVAPLFNRLFLVERTNLVGESLNSIEDVQQLIANQIFLEGMTDVGSRIWEYDVNVTTERRQREGKLVAFIYSSFANSSLVVPRDEMLEYCELKYADALLHRGLLHELTPDERNQINVDVTQVFGRLTDLVAGGSEGEGAWAEEVSPEASTRARRAAAPLEQLQQELNTVIQRYGIRGARYFAERLGERVHEHVEALRRRATNAEQELQGARERLETHQDNRPLLARLRLDWLPWFGVRSARRYRRRLVRTRRAVERARQTLDETIRRRDRGTRLQATLEPLIDQLQDRVALIENVRSGEIAGEVEQLFGTTRPAAQRPFELFTIMLGREYIEEELYPRVLESGLRRQLDLDAGELLNDPAVCTVQAVTAEEPAAGTTEHRLTLELAPTDQARLAATARSTARATIGEYIAHEQLHIRTILKSRNTDIQTRLRDLFTRCKPFWRYDLEVGGFSEAELEEIVFAGVAQKEHRDWTHLLRDFPEFQLVETNDPTRIDACRVVHGLPIEYLDSLRDMKAKYDRFFREHTGPLQLDRRWEPDGDSVLPELIGEPPYRDAVAEPAAEPTVSTPRGDGSDATEDEWRW